MTRELLALLLAVGAPIALGGRVQAQQPTPAAATPPAATPPAAPTSSPPSTAKETAAPTNATATAAAAPAASTPAPAPAPDNLLRRARNAGFKPEVRAGVTQYCIKEDKAETGTHFHAAKKCYDEAHLLALLDQRDADRDVLRSMHQNNPNGR